MGIEELRRVLEETIRELGEDHPRALVARTNLGKAHVQAGDYIEALSLHEQVLDGVVRLVGPDDRATVAALNNLAHVWFRGWLADKRPELTIPLWELAVAERVRVAGANDPDTLSARNDLATAHLAAGQLARAMAGLEHTLADCVRVLGDNHSLTQVVRANAESLTGNLPAPILDRTRDTAMTHDIVTALSEVLGLAPAVTDGRVRVPIPAIGETLTLPVCDVKRFRKSFTPMGDVALEFVMADGDDVRPLIALADDVLFAPDDPVAVLHSPIPVVISNAPPLISYSEMVRDAERFAIAATSPGGNEDRAVAGSCLLSRCVIAGAVRFGLRSLRAVAWWQRGWAAVGPTWDLPPFPHDPVWDHLTRCTAGMAMTPSVVEDRADTAAAVAALTVADFAALEPRLSVAQLNEEFIGIWKTLIPITPATFADLLMDRLGDAQADVTLYPDGAGTADLLLRNDGEFQALLQLRFDLRAREMRIDEIRIADGARGQGLFQRLQFNSEQLGRALDLDRRHVMATGMGAYAFAKEVFPRDPELYKKIHERPDAR